MKTPGTFDRWARQGKNRRRKARHARGPRPRRLRVEQLEDRRLLTTIYVDDTAAGSNNGGSWANAYTALQSALTAAEIGDEIHVAEGTYRPSSQVGGTGARYATFQMKNGVTILGGFPDGGGVREPATYVSILSGDIGTVGNNSDNVYHVFYHPTGTNLDNTAVLDGFRITAGNADGSVAHQNGAGMLNNSSSPTVTNCTFADNTAASLGGGMFNSSSSPKVMNCIFSANTAWLGGGMFNGSSSSPTVTNCTFAGNTAPGAGGMYNHSSSPTVTNCIFWANTGGQIEDYNSSPTVTYSNVQDGYTGTGNINADPLFVDADGPDNTYGTLDDDLHLRAGSPCIDAGIIGGLPPTDFEGDARRLNDPNTDNTGVGVVDMGADEFTDTLVSLSGGELFITDVAGGNSNDTLTISLNAAPDPDQFVIRDAGRLVYARIPGATSVDPNEVRVPVTGITQIVVNTLGGNDTVTVDALGSLNASLKINGGTGNDTVNLNGDITFAAGKNLDVDLQDDAASPGIDRINVGTDANLVLSGTGTATLKASRNILLDSGSSVEVVDGNLTVEANQQATPTSGDFVGVLVDRGVIESAGSGTVTVKGKGAATGIWYRAGVYLINNGRISGGSGMLTVDGTGGASTSGNAYGVFVTNSSITSSGGDVQVTGQGGGSGASTEENFGVRVSSNGTITAGGSGTVTV